MQQSAINKITSRREKVKKKAEADKFMHVAQVDAIISILAEQSYHMARAEDRKKMELLSE